MKVPAVKLIHIAAPMKVKKLSHPGCFSARFWPPLDPMKIKAAKKMAMQAQTIQKRVLLKSSTVCHAMKRVPKKGEQRPMGRLQFSASKGGMVRFLMKKRGML